MFGNLRLSIWKKIFAEFFKTHNHEFKIVIDELKSI